MGGLSGRSAFDTLSDNFNVGQAKVDAALLNTFLSTTVSSVAGATGRDTGAEAATNDAAAAIDPNISAVGSKAQQIMQLLKQFGGGSSLTAEANLTDEEIKSWVDGWYGEVQKASQGSGAYNALIQLAARKFWEDGLSTAFQNAQSGYEKMVDSLRMALGVDRVLAIASLQINEDMSQVGASASGYRARYMSVAQMFMTDSTQSGTVTTKDSGVKTAIVQSGSLDFSSSAESQFVFFSTPFIDTAGAYNSKSTSSGAAGKGSATYTPVLPNLRPFADGDSSTTFDMRNIALASMTKSVVSNGQTYQGDLTNYVIWNAGGGNDRALMSARVTLFDGGTSTGAKASSELDIADYGLTFDSASGAGGNGVSGHISASATGTAGGWLVRKDGSATLPTIVTKSATSKVGKRTTTVNYTVTENVRQQIFNAWDILRNVESISGTGDADNFTGGRGRTVLAGAGGADSFGNVFNDTIIGGSGADVIQGGTSATNGGDAAVGSYVDGGDDKDTIRMVEGANTLVGGAGADTIVGGQGADLIIGDGADTISVGTVLDSDRLSGEDGADTILGGYGDDFIEGGLGDDILIAGAGNDTALGGDGADTIAGDAGNDFLGGGLGNDTLWGGDRNDTLGGGDGNDCAMGGNGNDSLLGGTGNDNLFGEAGNDTLMGEDGDDFLYGGVGNNLLLGGAGNDTLIGDVGIDTLQGGDGDDFLCDSGGRNLLSGGAGNDILVGFEEAIKAGTVYDGGDGADIFSARLVTEGGIVASLGAGRDALGNVFSAAGVRIAGQTTGATLTGIENIEGSEYADTMTGDGGANIIVGRGGNDKLYGLGGVDYLHGGAGADTLYGGADHDLLVGAEGNDYLVGGAAGDTYAFEGKFGNDVVATTHGDIDPGDVTDYAGDVFLFNDTVFTDLVFIDERATTGAEFGDLVISAIDRNNPVVNLRSVRVKNFTNAETTGDIVIAASTGDGHQALISSASILLLASEMAAKGVTAAGVIAYNALDTVADAQAASWTIQQSA